MLCNCNYLIFCDGRAGVVLDKRISSYLLHSSWLQFGEKAMGLVHACLFKRLLAL